MAESPNLIRRILDILRADKDISEIGEKQSQLAQRLNEIVQARENLRRCLDDERRQGGLGAVCLIRFADRYFQVTALPDGRSTVLELDLALECGLKFG